MVWAFIRVADALLVGDCIMTSHLQKTPYFVDQATRGPGAGSAGSFRMYKRGATCAMVSIFSGALQ